MYKPVWITARTKYEFNIRKKISRKGRGMVKSKPYRPLEGNESKIPTDRNKLQASKPKKYRGKKPRNRPIPEPETEADFQCRYTDLEGYTLTLYQ